MIPYVVKGQLDSLEKELEAKIANASSEPKSVTYDELVALVHSSKLIVGKEYRITDYCTTIVEENGADPECEFGLSPYKSARHPFDIIVTAVSKDKLGQKARAAIHEGDEYFAESHLEQWELYLKMTMIHLLCMIYQKVLTEENIVCSLMILGQLILS